MLVSASQLLPNAVAHEGVDQSFTGSFDSGSGFTAQVTGQTFTPTENNIIVVDLFLFGSSSPSDTVTVTIRNGGVFGSFLGAKSMDNLNLGSDPVNPAVVHFDFNSLIPLVPGQTYGIQFESTLASITGSSSGGNPYSGGIAFQNNNPFTDIDWGFATYFSENFIPPQKIGGELLPINTIALLLAGVQTNLGWIIPVAISAVGISAFLVKRKF